MRSLPVLFFAVLLRSSIAEQLRARNAEPLPLKQEDRRLYNIFNLQSLLNDKTKAEQVVDAPQPGRTYFNLFTSIFASNREESESENTSKPPVSKPKPPVTTDKEETEPKVEVATLAPTVLVVPASTPVSAEEVKETVNDFLSDYPYGWVPKAEGTYSEIFLSVFASRNPPTVSPVPSISPAPSASLAPSTGTEGPTASAFPSTSSMIPTSQIQSVPPSESGSPSLSASPSGSSLAPSGAPSTSFPPSISASPSSAGTESESPTQSQVPTSVAPSISEFPSFSALPSFTPSTSNSSAAPTTSAAPSISSKPSLSAAPSALSNSTSLPPSLAPSTSSPPSVARVEGAFATELNLDQVPESYRQVFIAAAARWDTVIVGDLEDFTLTDANRATAATRCDPATVPDVVDDVFICASLPNIDGPVGILGTAGPLIARSGDILQTSVGYMQFDLADVEILNGNGQLAGTILHEMAHVYGIGTLWGPNSLTETTATCPYRYDSKASAEYRALSGCDASVPIETDGAEGTKCVHWDEDCFQSELMTGINTGEQELSRITIAGLEDLGYVVDYNSATPFPATLLAPSCNCNARRDLIADIPKERALETEAGVAARLSAIDYGLGKLKSNRVATMDDDGHSVYMGDKVIVVLYWADEQVKSVIVTSDA